MKVFGLPADDSACGAYRVAYPLAAAATLGIDTHVAQPAWPQHKASGEVPVSLHPEDADVIIAHRPSYPALVEELARLQCQGYALIVDVDDDLEHGHADHPWTRGERGLLARQSQKRACDMADIVTASTQPLADLYAPHGRAFVLRNRVPAAMLTMPRESDGRTLGWAGLASGHPGDLPVTAGAIADVLEGSGWTFKVIGPAEDVREQLGLTTAPTATGGLTLQAYQRELGTLDVGIVPLADTPFNRSKSWLKGVESLARGVPFVASALPEYLALAAQGGGLIANTPADWRRHLGHLMRDEPLRCEQATAGRALIEEHHTYERRAADWCEAWQHAVVNRRSGRAA